MTPPRFTPQIEITILELNLRSAVSATVCSLSHLHSAFDSFITTCALFQRIGAGEMDLRPLPILLSLLCAALVASGQTLLLLLCICISTSTTSSLFSLPSYLLLFCMLYASTLHTPLILCAPCVIGVVAGLEDLHDAVDQASLDGSGHTSRDLFREELRKQEQLGSSLGVHLKIPHLQEPHRRHRVARGDQTTLAKMA